ncbi:MAG: response regulator transcription factor [Dehalococcoidia bacterium]|nr:response regulator transcription factor [Dehalococcoidia bacterium]
MERNASGHVPEFDLTEQTILIVEDEENLLEALRYNLEHEGYRVVTATDGGKGLEAARETDPSLIILDIMLPTLDGFDICRLVRRTSDVPILMLTAKAEEVDKVVGLEIGADDYVVKPFSMRELLARVRAMLRRPRHSRGEASDTEVIRAGSLELDQTSHAVRLKGQHLDLKPREFDLLALLMANKGRAYTRHQILDRVWGQDYIGDTRTVDVHVRWLREKIEPDPGSPKMIVTIRGVGYKFQA